LKHLILIGTIAFVPAQLLAQDQAEEDKSYLTTLIEDNLSGASRDVNIVGFEGALSSAATIKLLAVSDAEGIWLSLEDVVLDWNRAALLRGQIDVNELGASKITIARAPIADANALPSPEAQGFSLPDLPVGISLDKLDIAEIVLGESFLGEELRLSLTGDAALSGGEGSAAIIATRLGDKLGSFKIDGSYGNISRQLALTLGVEEGPNGIAATKLALPGAPATKLLIDGSGPIDDYAAKLTLATDGQDRLAGDFRLKATDTGQVVQLNLGGDVTPLFAPEYQDFFGDDVLLDVRAKVLNDGQVSLEAFDIAAKSVQMSGSAEIGAEGWPKRLDLSGQIADTGGQIVLLPLSGPKTYVDNAKINLTYDAAVSNDWTAHFDIAGYDRPGMLIRELLLEGGGILVSGDGDAVGEVTANFTYGASGLELDNTGAAEAFGDKISGVLMATRTEGFPTKISTFTLTGPGIEAAADAVITQTKPGLSIQSNVLLDVDTLSRFSTLAGRDLGGSGSLAIGSEIKPLDGMFDVVLSGTSQDLVIGIPQLDAVFKGGGTISASAVRDEDGTRLEAFKIKTTQADLTASANLTSLQSVGNVDLIVEDVSLIEPKLSGPARITGTAQRDLEGITTANIQGSDSVSNLALNAILRPLAEGQAIEVAGLSTIRDLRHYARLVGRDMSGGAEVELGSTILENGLRVEGTLNAATSNLAVGVAQLDPLLRGDGTVSARFARLDADRFSLSDLKVSTPELSLQGNASGGVSGEANLDLTARINDVGLLGQGLRGAVDAEVNATRDADDNATVKASVSGPGTAIDLAANVAPDYAISGVVTADVANLATYRNLIGQPVSGGLSARVEGNMQPDLSSFAANLTASTSSIGIGNPLVDVLFTGTGQLRAQAGLKDGTLNLQDFSYSTNNLSISGDLGKKSGNGRGAFEARLRDVGLLTDQLSGPVTAAGTASLDNAGNWGIDALASGPGGITINTSGQIGKNGQLNLNSSGRAPLGLANNLLEPRRLSGDATFDINVNGPAALESVSGRIDLIDARLAAPTLGQALTNMVGGVTLQNGAANINLSADVQTGGSLAVDGPVILTSPQTADIAITLRDIILKDPELYQTTITGGLTVKGALQGGAVIAGKLELGQTDIQVPSSDVGALGDLPVVTHFGQSAAVKDTLAKAGALASGADVVESTTTGPVFPLDIRISAPSRIFIRGRGLDAELGGSLRIGGTTQVVQPTGLFELTRGRIDILQQRFELTEGSASLQGSFEPYIRLVAQTEARTGTTIKIIVEGPASAPEVTFESIPSLPQDEVLSQLIFGRDLANISPLQAVQLAAAVSTLAGRGGGGLINSFREGIGLDDFDVTTDDDGNAAVRAGKYLSDTVYTDVTVSNDGTTDLSINLDITNQVTAKGTVNNDGETSIGIFFQRDY